ncbi:MAG: hypothetical protein Q8L49_05820 [Burkholderiaceae bacterium]|nr:hypothetical protein [Burkholderiaceae bacterium]
MVTLNSYRVLSTSTTASFMVASAMAGTVAMATALKERDDSTTRAPAAPLNVFEPAGLAGSRIGDFAVLPVDYKLVSPFELSQAGTEALGDDGLERLERFKKLLANWDLQGARPLDTDSLAAFSQFFRDTGLKPDGLALFMSRNGNIVVNWVDGYDLVVELEFAADGLHYFVERTGAEGVASPQAVARFLSDLSQSLAA